MKRQPVATASSYYHHAYAPQLAQPGHYHDPAAFTTLGYRPLQLPLQHQQQQHHSVEQLGLASPAGFHHPSFRAHHQHAPASSPALPLRTRQQVRRHQQDTMAFPQQSEEDMAELQKLSNEYEPEVNGPLVGPREASTSIATEYASADPVFQAKTAALPQKYSYYRTVRGDGRCGWRAIGYGYVEALIHHGDSTIFLEEEGRLKSLSNVLNAAGYNKDLYDDFADQTYDLLREVRDALSTGDADRVLHDAFNDELIQNYIITHLRMLTAAWMRTRPGDYAPWLIGQTVDQFCENSVMPMGAEIDNVSLHALKDVLLSPAGIALEVLYLDRTEGSEVNMHRFDPVNHHGGTLGTIRLLYRPGHYDILYKMEDLPQITSPITYLQYGSHSHYEPAQDLGVSDFMTMIPGMSFANPQSGWSDFFAPSASGPQCTHSAPTPVAPTPQPQIQTQAVPYMPATPAHLVAPSIPMSQDMVIRSGPHATFAPPGFQNQLSGPFRPSMWELEADFVQSTSHVPFQTTQFKNSHFNTAHFLNPDFQPEEWTPDHEYVTTSSKSLRHRNSA